MSTTIYEKELPVTKESEYTKRLGILRFAMGQKSNCKCGYVISVGDNQVTLNAQQIEDLMRELNVFFYAEGYS